MFQIDKMKFYHFFQPPKKYFWLLLEKSTIDHPGKNPADVLAAVKSCLNFSTEKLRQLSNCS